MKTKSGWLIMSIGLLFVILINPNPQMIIQIFYPYHICEQPSDEKDKPAHTRDKDKPAHTRKLARAFAARTYNVHVIET